MFIDKFRNRYSFNFLVVCGWVIFLQFCFFICPELYITYVVRNTEHAFGVGVFFLCVLIISAVSYVITFFINVFEIISLKRITCEKFLNNKYVKIFQTLGIAFAFLPIIIMALLFISNFLVSVSY